MKNPTILGAIAGDTIGSVYEFNPTKSYNFEMFYKDMSYTDDSIMTIAVADWILHDPTHSHEMLVKAMRWYGQKEPCPMGSYGGGFSRWLRSDRPMPYNSWGNGSAMRVGAVGYAFDTMEETLRVAKISAEVTHNHPEGIKGAQATAAAIFLARQMATKTEIRNFIETNFGYDLHRSYTDVKDGYAFRESCQETVPESIIAFLESNSFEDAIRLTVALGGDADTMGAITGAIAAAYYREVPDNIAAFTLERLPEHLRKVVVEFNERYGYAMNIRKEPYSCGVTPEMITELEPNQIFVFGSNLQGAHGGGAARTAVKKFGAIWGVGVGIQGRSYAIPTMHGPVESIRPYVDQFIEYAVEHQELHFLVTPIGCGIAGFTPQEIAPLFARAIHLSNVSLPKSFIDILVPTDEKLYSVEALIKHNYHGEYVFFWGHHEKPGKISKACFSQWYPSTFTVDGVAYNCMEQYMMAEKARLMGDLSTRQQILAASDPKDIKALGRQVKNFDEAIWNDNKMSVVLQGNFAKFTQNINLRDFIISTAGKVLVEASPYDRIWGVGLSADDIIVTDPKQWKGTNLLGFALMAVRDKILEMIK